MSVQTETPLHANVTEAPPVPQGSDRPWAIQSLPPFPAVALQLMSLLDDDDVPMKQVVNLLRVDPALSAEILRVSNSALYGLSRRIDNVSHAVVVLGSETVKRLALTAALGRFSQRIVKNKTLRVCWDHSIACALIGEQLAALMGTSKDRAYTAGLLSDIGRLALLSCYPDEYAGMLEVARDNHFDQLECERELFDIDHCAAGQYMAHQWNLPPDIITAIGHHHEPSPVDNEVLSVVCAATKLSDAIGFSVVQREEQPSIEDALADVPISNVPVAVETFEKFAEGINSAIATISPR